MSISEDLNERFLLCIEVSSFQGVGIRGVPLYTEVSSFQGVGITGFVSARGVGVPTNKPSHLTSIFCLISVCVCGVGGCGGKEGREKGKDLERD